MKVPSGCIMCPWVSPQHAGQTVIRDINCLWQTMYLSTALINKKRKKHIWLWHFVIHKQFPLIKKVFTFGHWEIPALLVPPQRSRSTCVPLESMTYHQKGLYQKMTIHHHFVQDWPVESIFVSQTFRFESPHPSSEALPEHLRWKRLMLIVVHHYTFIDNNTCSI